MSRKTMRILTVSAALGLSFAAGAYAQETMQKVEAYLRPDFKVTVNGNPAALSGPPLVYENSSFLPLKQIGDLLGAQVNWDNETKTIHIVTRLHGEQPETPEQVADEIRMSSPRAEKIKYLGRTYTLLKIYDEKWATYYRLSDARRMGIDTKGLKLAKEKYTEELYVGEDELKKAWKEEPQPSYDYDYTNPVPLGEIADPKKTDALLDFAKSVSRYRMGDKEMYTEPILIEPGSKENQFYYWCRVNGKFSKYDITLIPYSELYGRPVDPNGKQYLPSGYTYRQLEPDTPSYYPY